MKMPSLIVATTVLFFIITLNPALASAQQDQQMVKTTSSNAGLSEVLQKYIPKDIPVLTDISIAPPDPSVPHELARFSGAWAGELRGQRTNAHMADQLYVFEKVSPTSVTLVSGGIGRFTGGSDSNYGKTWSSRNKLQPEGSKLTVTFQNGNWTTFQIEGELLSVRSRTWVGTFKRIQ